MKFTGVLFLHLLLATTIMALPVSRVPNKMTDGSAAPNVAAPVLYEVSTRPWLYQLKVSRLADVPDSELARIASMGVNVLWAMGMWELGAAGLKHDQTDPNLLKSYSQNLPGYTKDDIIGSPCAIVDYTVNTAEIGTESDLAAFRAKLHKHGMRLCLDFVPNHSAIDAPQSASDPSLYVLQPKGEPFDPSKYVMVNGTAIAYGSDVYSGAWTDTIQWNYWNPETRKFLTSALVSIAKRADYVRCDMAMNQLNKVFAAAWGDILRKNGYNEPSTEFWSNAIRQAKQANPSFQIMAEAYVYGITPEPEDLTLQSLGFDYTYDKTLLDDLHDGHSVHDVQSYIVSRGSDYLGHAANFLSNHDEARAIPTLGGVAQSLAAAVITYTLPGLRFTWMGQFEGFSDRLDVHLRRETSETPLGDVTKFYSTLLNNVFHGDSSMWNLVNLDSGLLGWYWDDGKGKRQFAVINYQDMDSQFSYAKLPNCQGKGGSDDVEFTDVLTGTVYKRKASDVRGQGLGVLLNRWQAQVFDYSV